VKSIRYLSVAVFILLIPGGLLADDAVDLPRPAPQADPVGDLFPPSLQILRSPEEVLRLDIGFKIKPEPGSPVITTGLKPTLSLLDEGGGAGRRSSRTWPIVLSVLCPGAGEIYLGYYKRGIALAVAEVGAWSGYFYYHDKGLDERKDYENFADRNWDFDRWIAWHADAYPLDLTFAELDSIGRGKWTTGGGWPPYHPFFPKETEKQNYYETIGKYDWFISGWSDYDPDTQPHDTDLRTQYRSMRKISNDDLKTANRFIYLSLAARAFSIVEIILLSRDRDTGWQNGDAGLGGGFDLTFRPTGFIRSELALEYRF
jgi:hypothetical protein